MASPTSAVYSNSSSTVQLQTIVDIMQSTGLLRPVLETGGNSLYPALAIANDVMNAICAVSFPHKWNESKYPDFYTNSFQQDYAVVDKSGNSITDVAWFERGTAWDINNTAIPKPTRQIEVGRQLPQSAGVWWNSATNNPLFLVNWFPNYMLYYGTWGETNNGNSSIGNNPVANSVYTFPLGVISQPANPITQIKDANGNYLVLTTYGTEGSTAPLAPVNAAPGTTASGSGASTVWTVVDPNGMGVRIIPVPSQTGVVWQFKIIYQKKPVRFTSLQQTLSPLPDEFEPHFRQGFMAGCYKYAAEKAIHDRYESEWNKWLLSLNSLKSKEARELEENQFVPDRGVMGSRRGRGLASWWGPAWPFNGMPGSY